MSKKQQDQIFNTKEFNLYLPFSIKDISQDESGDGEVIKIKGYANYSGDVDDEESIFVDHSGDVMVPSGFDLSVWKTNPQILMNHDRSQTIGKGIKATKKKDGLEIEAEIHQKACEEEDWYRIKNGLVTRFSVGFRTVAGEWKEIDKRQVFFITKSLLYEVSVVSIPCNAQSGFSLIKSLGEGNFSMGELDETNYQPTQEKSEKYIGESTMKLKLKELLSEEKIEEFKSLGLTEKLEEETDVDVKAFIDAKIKAATSDLKVELEAVKAAVAELSKKEEVTTEEKGEEETNPSTETQAEEEASTEEKAEEVQEPQVDLEQVKLLQDSIEKLKALVAEEK